MTLAYSARLICLCLACFGLVQVVTGSVVYGLAQRVIGMASRLPARSAARLLLAVRLLPAGAGLFVILGLCLPSYLWLEEEPASEPVSLLCVAAAATGATILGIGMIRTLRAWIRSPRVSGPDAIRIEGENCCLIDSTQPVLALTGVFHSRMLLSPPVLRALPPKELSLALGHERAHRASRDNLKRVLLRLAPLPVPALDRAWSKFAEWSADDAAVDGDADRCLTLASALVRFAKLSVPERISQLASYLLADEHDLATRVERLLAIPAPAKNNCPRWLRVALTSAVTAFILAVLINPASLAMAHELLESLITGY